MGILIIIHQWIVGIDWYNCKFPLIILNYASTTRNILVIKMESLTSFFLFRLIKVVSIGKENSI